MCFNEDSNIIVQNETSRELAVFLDMLEENH